MAENSYAKNLLAQRGRRASATLLTWLENNVYEFVTPELQGEIRGKVLQIISEYQDLAMDMVASDTGTINEFWVEELDRIHSTLRSIDGHLQLSNSR